MFYTASVVRGGDSGVESEADWNEICAAIERCRTSDTVTLRQAFAQMLGHPIWRRAFMAGVALALLAGVTGPARSALSALAVALMVLAWIQGSDFVRRSLDLPLRMLSPAPDEGPQQVQLVRIFGRSRIRKPSLVLSALALSSMISVRHRPVASFVALLAFWVCCGVFLLTFRHHRDTLVDHAGDRFRCPQIMPILDALRELRQRGYILADAIPKAFRVVPVDVQGRNAQQLRRVRLLDSATLPCLGLAPAKRNKMLRRGFATIGIPLLLAIVPAIILSHIR